MKRASQIRHLVGSLLIVGVESTALSALESACLPAPFFRCVDLESGAVDRLRDLIGPTPSAAEVAATGRPQLFREHGLFIGSALHALGFNLDLTPVFDLALPAALPIMGSRAVSPDPAQVVAYARAFSRCVAAAAARVARAKHRLLGLGPMPRALSSAGLEHLQASQKRLHEKVVPARKGRRA